MPAAAVGIRSAMPIEFEPDFRWDINTQPMRFYTRHGIRRVRCAVSRPALEDRVRAHGLDAAGLERAFREHRGKSNERPRTRYGLVSSRLTARSCSEPATSTHDFAAPDGVIIGRSPIAALLDTMVLATQAIVPPNIHES